MTNRSFGPEHDAGEFDEAEGVCGELVISCGNAPPLLEPGEEAIDTPTLLEGDDIIATADAAVPARRSVAYVVATVDLK